MNKKAFLAIIIALGIPFGSYFLMKGLNSAAVKMPPRYLLDSVTTSVQNGKQVTDSVWHTVGDIKLINQLGDTVHLHDIKNKVIVADFFFTRCGSICPTLTKHMAKLQRSFTKGDVTKNNIDTSMIQFLSFSIDPERDSVPILKAYADKYGAIHDNWWFLTGNKDSIYNFIFQELKVDKYDDTPIDPNFAHTGRYVLIDKDFHVRGYYNGLDTAVAIPALANDAALIMIEKDKYHPDPLPFDPAQMVIILILAVIAVIILLKLISKKKPSNPSLTK